MDQNVINKDLRQHKSIFNKCFSHFYIFIILMSFTIVRSFKLRHNRAVRSPCFESMKTIRVVQNCPTNKESWEERATLKDCGKIQQNCSETSLVYHCLLDKYGRGLLEVCALTTEIIGRRCAEFNSGAMFVQEHLEERCKQCPFAYSSNMGYLYDECLKGEESKSTTESTTVMQNYTTTSLVLSSVFQNKNSSAPEENIGVSEENSANGVILIVVGILSPILSVILVMALNVLKSKKLEMKGKDGHRYSNEAIALMTEHNLASDEEVIYNWKVDDSCFIETKYFTKMMEKVRKQSYMTFVGVPGSGRSATVRHIALKLQDEGYEVVPLQDIRDLNSHFFDLHKPQVFVIDDVIGIIGLQRLKLSHLLKSEQDLTNPRVKKLKVLMTCREEMFDKCYRSFFTNEQHVIRLHNTEDTLSDDDKKKILEKHGLDRNLLSPSSLGKKSNMFPFLCKLYSKEDNFRRKGETFFISPLQCIYEELDNMRNENNLYYATLVLCVLNCNKLSEENLKKEENEHFQEMKSNVLQSCKIDNDTKTVKFVNSLVEMDGIYTKRCGRNFAIIHDLMFEIIAYHFGSQFPELILKYMSSSYIATNVKTNTLIESDVENKLHVSSEIKNEHKERFDLSIKLHSNCYSLLAERLHEDLEKMELHDVFMNDVLKHPEVCQAFLEVLQRDSYEKIKVLFLSEQEDVSKQVIQCGEAESKCREMGEVSEELRKQQLMVHRKLIGKKIVNCVRGISWVVYYGHHQILRYIEEQTEQHKETESELFKELYRDSKLDNAESNNFAKQKKTCSQDNDADIDSYEKRREKEIFQTSEKKWNTSNCMFSSERTRLLVLGCYSGDVETVKILLKHVDKDSVNRSLQFSSDIYDSWGWDTPLTAACDSGKISIVKELLQIGANVNQEGKYVTPLIAACQGGYLDILQKILEFEADINLPGKFDTPLTAACRGGLESVTKILLKNGANVNQQGTYDTPLTVACKNGHLDLVLELLKAGADVNLLDNSNETPLTAARNGQHRNVVFELQKFGADNFPTNEASTYNNEDDTIADEMTEGVDIR